MPRYSEINKTASSHVLAKLFLNTIVNYGDIFYKTNTEPNVKKLCGYSFRTYA